jgi:hypothetical protein
VEGVGTERSGDRHARLPTDPTVRRIRTSSELESLVADLRKDVERAGDAEVEVTWQLVK